MLPDILKPCDDVEFFVAKVNHKRLPPGKNDPDDDGDGYGLFDWTIDLIIDLADDEMIDGAPPYLAGAKSAVRAAKDGHGTGTRDYKPLDSWRNVRVTLDGAIEDAGAEVRLIEVIGTKDTTRYRAKVKIPGLTVDASAALLGLDQRTVSASFRPAQAAPRLTL